MKAIRDYEDPVALAQEPGTQADEQTRARRRDTVARSTGAPTPGAAVADTWQFGDAVNAGIHALPGGLRERFEASLGADLGGVRIHDHAEGHAAARSLGARAYAVGQDVVMGAGAFAPHTRDGAWLLAHEVAHTVQQRGATAAPMAKLEVGEEGGAGEREADAAAHAMIAGDRATVTRQGSAAIQRFTDHPIIASPVAGQQNTVAMARELRRVLEHRVADMSSGEQRPAGERNTPRLVETGARAQQEAIRNRIAADHAAITALLSVQNDAEGRRTLEDIARARGISLREQVAAADQSHEFTAGGNTHRTTDTELLRNGAVEHAHTNGAEVSPNGFTHTRSDSRSESHADGRALSTSNEVTRRARLADAGLDLSHSRVDTQGHTRANGTGEENRTQTTRDAQVNSEHALYSHAHGERHRDTDAEGNHTDSTSGRTYRGGAVFEGENYGLTAGHTRTSNTAQTNEEGTVTSSRSSSVGGDATLTNHDATLAGRGSLSATEGHASISTSLGTSGGVHVDVEPVEGSVPPRFAVVMRLEIRGSLGGTGGTLGYEHGSVSGGLDIAGAHTVTFRHEMSEQQVRLYTNEVRAVAEGTAPSSEAPELTMMQRLRAANDHTDLTQINATANPRVADQLAEGSSVESTDTLSVTGRGAGTLGTEALGVGGSASENQTVTRSVRVGRVGDLVEIRMSFNDERTSARSGSVHADGVAAQVGTTSTNGGGQEVTVRLHPRWPMYEADFARVLACRTRAQAEATAAALGGATSEQTHTANGTNVAVGLAGEDGVGTGLASSSTHDETSNIGRGAYDVNTGRQAALSGTTVGTSDQRTSLNVAGRAAFTATDATTATSRLETDGTQTVDVVRTETSRIAALPDFLQQAWHTTHRALEELHYNDAQVEQLAARAANAHGWLNALSGGAILHVQGPWNQLGDALRNPAPDPRWVAADAVLATRLARGQAITHFIAQVGSDDGLAALRALSGGVARETQWPEEIASQAGKFHAQEERVEHAAAYYRTFTGADRAATIRAFAEETRTQLRGVLAAVQGCSGFRDSQTKVATLTSVQELLARNDREMAAALTGGEPASDELSREDRSALALLQLRTYKSEEHRHWVAAQSQIQHASAFFANPNDCYNAAISELDQIAATYPGWIAALHEAETAQPGSTEHLHPNAAWSVQLLQEAARIGSVADAQVNRERAAAWLAAAQGVPR